MIRRLIRGFVVGASLLALPALVHAQSAITGVVKDTSGAVLPGVTVEASSDALIEKTKSVVTDGDGVYRIVDLRPGTYVVTFTLTGFSTLRRDGDRAAVRVHGHDQRRPARRRPRGVDHGHGRCPGRGRHDGGPYPGAEPRGDGCHPDGPHDSGHGPAGRGHQPEPAGHGRRPRHAADLHVHARHDGGQHDGDGGRHDRERAAVRRNGAELLQRRDEPGNQLPDLGHRGGHAGRRRADQHDSARGRQPVQRRLQGGLPAGRVAGRQPDAAPHRQGHGSRGTRPTGSPTTRSRRAARS